MEVNASASSPMSHMSITEMGGAAKSDGTCSTLQSNRISGPVRDSSAPAIPGDKHGHTGTQNSAVTRRWSDMHAPTWVGLMTLNVVLRTLLFHPLELAICRKRVTRENDATSVTQLMRAAWRGGEHATADARYPVYNLGRGGLRGFYRGVGVALVANLAGELIFCYVLERTKERVEREAHARAIANSSKSNDISNNNNTHNSICGRSSSDGDADDGKTSSYIVCGYAAALGAMYAGLTCIALISPLVLVANKQMTASYGMASQNPYRNTVHTFREIWRTHTHVHSASPSSASSSSSSSSSMHAVRAGRWRTALPHLTRIMYGIGGLYRGSSVGLLRVPSFGVWWAIYVTCKAVFYETADSVLPHPHVQPKARTHDPSGVPSRPHDSNEHRCTTAPSSSSASGDRVASAELASAADSACGGVHCPDWLTSATDNPAINASAAVCASVITTLMFNPLAVVQTRQQTLRSASYMNGHTSNPALPQKQHSRVRGAATMGTLLRRMIPFRRAYDIAADLYRKEGMHGFYKGARANVYSSVLDGIVFSTFFELIKLGSDNQFLEA